MISNVTMIIIGHFGVNHVNRYNWFEITAHRNCLSVEIIPLNCTHDTFSTL